MHSEKCYVHDIPQRFTKIDFCYIRTQYVLLLCIMMIVMVGCLLFRLPPRKATSPSWATIGRYILDQYTPLSCDKKYFVKTYSWFYIPG